MQDVIEINDSHYRPLPWEKSMDIETAADLAKEAWTDHLINEGRPLSDFVPEPFGVRFMTNRECRLNNMADAMIDNTDQWFDDFFVHYCNAVSARATAKTYTAMGEHNKALEQYQQCHDADRQMGMMMRLSIERYIRDMEERESE